MSEDRRNPDEVLDEKVLDLPSIGERLTEFTDRHRDEVDDSSVSTGSVDTSSLTDGSTWGGFRDDVPEIDLAVDTVDLETRYEIIRSLGRGGMGEVWLAHDRRLGRQVAIKRVRLASSNVSAAQARFQTEAQAIAALNHPGIVEIYDFGKDSSGSFLIMEYLSGGSLMERLNSTIAPEDAVKLTLNLCDALGIAHKAGIIHRDIKPANILLTADGRPKLTDFGLAKRQSEDHGITVTGAVLGTADYMPPEQRLDAARADARSDIWSLAATLYQMLSGSSPRQIRFQKVPQAFQVVLEKALEEVPDLRYATAMEFREALSDALLVSSAPPEIAADLDCGQCSSCGTINNSARKFCKSCGHNLRTTCLSCQAVIPEWDRYCSECGTDQRELMAARQEQYLQSRHLAQEYRASLEYAKALEIADELARLSDSRFEEFSTWASQFIEEGEPEAQQQRQHVEQCVEEAKQHRASFDYEAAIRSLDRIPEALLSTEAKALSEQLNRERQEAKTLVIEIRRRLKEERLDGFQKIVQDARQLLGQRQDLDQLEQ